MQPKKQAPSYSNFLSKLIKNITSTSQFSNLRNSLLQLHEEQSPLQIQKANPKKMEQKQQKMSQQHKDKTHQESLSKNNNQNLASNVSPLQSNTKESKLQYSEQLQKQGKPFAFRSSTPKQYLKRQKQPLTQPPLIQGKRNYTEQSSEKSKTNQKQSISGGQKRNMKSSQSQYINLQLTQRSKKQKTTFMQGKVDSLLYSDVTLLYSNDTGFGQASKNNHQGGVKVPHLSQLKKNGEQEDINTKMQRAQSRQCSRIPTQSQRASEAQKGKDQLQKQSKQQENIFKTQINQYKHKISKIRQLKQNKKRKLQAQLRRVNQQLEELTKKQHSNSASRISKPNNFESRVKISDNIQAKVKAQKLVRYLTNEKKNREDVHLGELHVIDKNINNYMQELMKERYKNQQRIKQRKKLQIIDRMKQQQMRKIEQQKQKQKNIQFVHQLRGSNSRNQVQAQRKITQSPNQPVTESVKSKQRNPTKKSESLQEITPQLSRKKAYLKKIRNINFKKQKVDQYEQLLH